MDELHYYQVRADRERELAMRQPNSAARQAHLDMAAHYEQRIAASNVPAQTPLPR
ncbi:hypothetical protein [Sphingomonas xinjiangensis]|uniref:Uncharacterized protein n=1 Tax=Sphingomonas xinjiangensis TaxID=643568 RepID=A0A840YR45_9SPHN|nr:hypothetical protein [Sphingomonas xinjiangensis]MBB5711901.1 hypothetical protein [Sphingomonas xinjiangensis]